MVRHSNRVKQMLAMPSAMCTVKGAHLYTANKWNFIWNETFCTVIRHFSSAHEELQSAAIFLSPIRINIKKQHIYQTLLGQPSLYFAPGERKWRWRKTTQPARCAARSVYLCLFSLESVTAVIVCISQRAAGKSGIYLFSCFVSVSV